MNRKEKEESSKKPPKISPKTKTNASLPEEEEKLKAKELKITQLEKEISELKK